MKFKNNSEKPIRLIVNSDIGPVAWRIVKSQKIIEVVGAKAIRSASQKIGLVPVSEVGMPSAKKAPEAKAVTEEDIKATALKDLEEEDLKDSKQKGIKALRN